MIYGDTDSLFILPSRRRVPKPRSGPLALDLAKILNDWWRQYLASTFRLDSYLEVEFETHFLRFLMPTIRGAETGSKKRYAGLIRTSKGDSRARIQRPRKRADRLDAPGTTLSTGTLSPNLPRMNHSKTYIRDTLDDLRSWQARRVISSIGNGFAVISRITHAMFRLTFRRRESSTSPGAGSAM